MDTDSYEQKQVGHAILESDAKYLLDNMELELLLYEGEVIDYILPKTVDLEVVDSEMAVAGDTATGATKEVITETGLKVRTPLFVDVGNTIRVNTDSGEYITRV
jgi:elongation factor P